MDIEDKKAKSIRSHDILEAELNKIFLPIAKISHSPEDFINKARVIKAVKPEVSGFFFDRFGFGGLVSMNEAARNYIKYSKTI
jgi:hypothetical protein